MILLLLLVFIRYYIGRGRLLFCPCSGCKAASLTELGVGYARENSPLRSLLQCDYVVDKIISYLGPDFPLFHCLNSVLNVKAVVASFNQEKALVGAFSVIVQPVVEPIVHYCAQSESYGPNIGCKYFP